MLFTLQAKCRKNRCALSISYILSALLRAELNVKISQKLIEIRGLTITPGVFTLCKNSEINRACDLSTPNCKSILLFPLFLSTKIFQSELLISTVGTSLRYIFSIVTIFTRNFYDRGSQTRNVLYNNVYGTRKLCSTATRVLRHPIHCQRLFYFRERVYIPVSHLFA